MPDEVSIVPRDQLELVTDPPVPGLERLTAFAGDGLWVGLVRTAPGSDSQWHHHGTYDTYVYGISGRARVEWGPGGRQSWEDDLSGAFVHVPAGVVHRENNPVDTMNEVFVVRVGSGGTPVVPVDGPAPE